jgi:hypothetical protein
MPCFARLCFKRFLLVGLSLPAECLVLLVTPILLLSIEVFGWLQQASLLESLLVILLSVLNLSRREVLY